MESQAMLATMAMYDLAPFLEEMSPMAVGSIELGLENTPPNEWDEWVKGKLLISKRAGYWRDVFSRD